ncbi:MAG: DUF488 family protein [Candidatus Bipolaricaulaceae bacterium]
MSTLFTVGHSNRGLSEFLQLLSAYGIEVVADVRAFPSSKHHPHFAQKTLAQALEKAGIAYVWLGRELGGYRKNGLGEASPNKAWDSQGFRNYADHMLSREFQRGVEKLLRLSAGKKVAVLCAERFWWRCHRRLLADWLLAHGHKVVHVLDLGRAVEHELPPFAKVVGGQVIYPGEGLWSPGSVRDSCRKNFPEGRPVV